MKNGAESGSITSDVAFILAQFFDGVGGCFKHHRICLFLIFSDELAYLLRDSECEHEIVTWQAVVELSL